MPSLPGCDPCTIVSGPSHISRNPWHANVCVYCPNRACPVILMSGSYILLDYPQVLNLTTEVDWILSHRTHVSLWSLSYEEISSSFILCYCIPSFQIPWLVFSLCEAGQTSQGSMLISHFKYNAV
jgi:hypothetical protein